MAGRAACRGGAARFDLGDTAAKWADAIRNPRTLIDKLGVKPTSRVAVIGIVEADVVAKLRARSPHVTLLDAPDAAAEESEFDLVLYRADEPSALDALARETRPRREQAT